MKTLLLRIKFFFSFLLFLFMFRLWVVIFGHPFGYLNTPLRIQQHPSGKKLQREYLLYSQRANHMTSKKNAEFTKLIKRFDTCKYDSNRAIFDVDYQA
jgi:hypothetical protein